MPETYDEVGALQTECNNCGVTYLVAPPIIPNKAISVICKDHFKVKCPYCNCYSLKDIYDLNFVNRVITDEYDSMDLVYYG